MKTRTTEDSIWTAKEQQVCDTANDLGVAMGYDHLMDEYFLIFPERPEEAGITVFFDDLDKVTEALTIEFLEQVHSAA